MTRLSPKKAADQALELLRRGADVKRAASYQRFFKDPVLWWGVENKLTKQILEQLLEQVGQQWTIEDAVRFCNLMVKDPHMEARGTGFQVVAHFVSQAGPELLDEIERWLEKSCGNWGLVDNLAPSVLGPLLARFPRLIPRVVEWTDSRSLWVRRGAVVAFVPLVKRKKSLPPAYRVITKLAADPEDLIHKAMGWLLREAGVTDHARLESFLLKSGARLPRTTIRCAIEKWPKAERAKMLAATRG